MGVASYSPSVRTKPTFVIVATERRSKLARVMPAPELHDLACVIHLHSTYSDGTGTVPEIAAAARANALDAVLLTDHDTLEAKRRGEEGYHEGVLVLVGEEVSPRARDHLLAFGPDQHVRHRGRTAAEVSRRVHAAGGIAFAAHPFSRGSTLVKRPAAMPYSDLDGAELTGIELWSFVTDSVEAIARWRDVAAFVARPERFVDHPPERNLAEWDRLCRDRRVVAIGGLDAHQIGVRVLGRVPLKLMSYRRSFSFLRTHVLCERAPTGVLEHDREAIFGALREGRCYLAMDSLEPARGFSFWGERAGELVAMGAQAPAAAVTLRVRAPRPAALRLLRDGELLASRDGDELEQRVEGAGVYRVEARLEAGGRERTWIVSNPIYLR